MGLEQAKQVLTITDPRDTGYDDVPGFDGSFKIKILRADPETGAGTFFTRIVPGGGLTWHWHSASEEFAVLKGTAEIQMRGEKALLLGPGSYSQVPGRTVHRFRTSGNDDCIILAIGDGGYDIHWVDDSGDEIAEEAAMARWAKDRRAVW